MNEETKNYELAFLLKSDQDYKEISKSINDAEVKISAEGQMTKIKLAYPIKKESFAYFGYLYLTSNTQNIKKLSEALRSNLKILRFLIFIKPLVKPAEAGKASRVRLSREPSEYIKMPEIAFRPAAPTTPSRSQNLSNEALEKKLEEILK